MKKPTFLAAERDAAEQHSQERQQVRAAPHPCSRARSAKRNKKEKGLGAQRHSR